MTADQLTQRGEPTVPSAGQSPPGRPTLSDRLPRPWLFPLIVFAATWVLILATWFGSDWILGQNHSWAWFFMYKDAGWYRYVAHYGYPAKLLPGRVPYPSTAFFPVFPGLIWLGSHLVGSYYFGGLLVSVLAGAASALMVWLVATKVRDRWVADRAVALYCFFPGAMTFGMLYSEPLTVALAAAAILALLNRRWVLAGVIGAIGTAEASTLVVLVAVSGFTALQAIWNRNEWRSLIAPVLTPVGILAYFGIVGHRLHDYGFYFQVEQHDWQVHVDWGARVLHILLWNMPADNQYRFVFTVYYVMLAAVVAGLAMMFAARLPLPVWLYGLLLVASFSLSVANPRPRFVFCAFPLFIGAAAKLPRVLYWPVLALSAAGLVLLVAWWPHHPIGPAP